MPHHRMSRKKLKIDRGLTKLLELKMLYVIILIVVFIYLYIDSRVINVPRWILRLEFILSILVLIVISMARYFRFRDYYRRKFKDPIFLVAFGLFFGLFVFLGRAVLRIPVALYFVQMAQGSRIEHVECQILNISTLKIDKITYRFNDESYWRYTSLKGLNQTEILNNHKVLLSVKLSAYGAYYIEDFQIVKDDSLP